MLTNDVKRFGMSARAGASLGSIAAAAILLAPSAVTAQSVQWTYASGWPKEHVQVGVIADEWIKRIETATEGRVKIRHVPSGTLLKPEAILDGVRKGVANCGPWVTGYKPGALPITTTLMGSMDLEYGSKLDIKGITAISNRLFDESAPFRKEFEDLGVRAMMWVPTTPYSIISKRPTKTLADLNGVKLRAFGTVLPKLQTAMGAVPVSVANAEMYTSIQTGVIDGAMTDLPQMVTAKLYEVAKNVMITGPGLGTNLAGASVVYICNEESLKGISEADRKKIAAVTQEMPNYISKAMSDVSLAALNELKNKGVTVTNLGDAELAALKVKAPLFDNSAKELDAQGLPGTVLAKRYRQLAADYLSGAWKP
jgi:TRAP-type transport system periplasmic protein